VTELRTGGGPRSAAEATVKLASTSQALLDQLELYARDLGVLHAQRAELAEQVRRTERRLALAEQARFRTLSVFSPEAPRLTTHSTGGGSSLPPAPAVHRGDPLIRALTLVGLLSGIGLAGLIVARTTAVGTMTSILPASGPGTVVQTVERPYVVAAGSTPTIISQYADRPAAAGTRDGEPGARNAPTVGSAPPPTRGVEPTAAASPSGLNAGAPPSSGAPIGVSPKEGEWAPVSSLAGDSSSAAAPSPAKDGRGGSRGPLPSHLPAAMRVIELPTSVGANAARWSPRMATAGPRPPGGPRGDQQAGGAPVSGANGSRRCGLEVVVPALAPGTAYVLPILQDHDDEVVLLRGNAQGRMYVAAGQLPALRGKPAAVLPAGQLPANAAWSELGDTQVSLRAGAGDLVVAFVAADGPMPATRAVVSFGADEHCR